MTDFLVKLFVKNADDIMNPCVRQNYGTLSGLVGICCNILLFVIKFAAGIITSSISVMADAFNNLSDAGSSIVTLIGFKMAGKPADKDHPYGHGRIEYISGLIIAFVILIMGFELLKSSVDKIFNPENLEFTVVSFVILTVSILLKLWMTLFNRKLGKKLGASAMLATAADSLNDSIATTVVLIGLFISYFTDFNIDGYAGVLVALFVLYSGYGTAKDTLQPLLGQPPDPVFVKAVQDCILKYDEICGIHDLIVHDYGPGRVIVSLHAEIPRDMDIIKAHDIIDSAEEEVKRKYNCDISIHMDPVATNDEFTNELKQKIIEIVKGINENLNIHDFRITNGPFRTNLIFDLEVPFDFEYSDQEITDSVIKKIKSINNSFYVIMHVDKKSY